MASEDAILPDMADLISSMYVIWTIFSSVNLIWFLCFAGIVEVRERKKTWSQKHILTPFNVALFLSILSLVGYNGFQSILLHDKASEQLSKRQRAIYEAFADLFQQIWALGYLHISFLRSSNQMRSMFQKAFPWIRLCGQLTPIVFTVPAVLAICKAINPGIFNTKNGGHSEFFWYQCSQILCTIILMGFDTIFLTCFVSFLRRTRVDDSEETDPKFLIIAKFGVVSTGLCILMIPLWTINIATYFTVPKAKYGIIFNVVTAIYSCAMNLVVAVLFGMKLSLHAQWRNEAAKEEKRLSRFRISDATIVVNSCKI